MSEVEALEDGTFREATRDCLDPWTYVEVRVNGDVAPCCVRGPVGNISEASLAEILDGPHVRQLRAELLTGHLDATCAGCRQRAPIEPSLFREKIRTLRDQVRLPEVFDPTSYLFANPDVARAGIPAERHFLKFGYLEGRPLRWVGVACEVTNQGSWGWGVTLPTS